MPTSDIPGAAARASANHTASAPGQSASLLAAVPWGVLLAPDGTVAQLNAAAEALWGLPAAAVLGRRPEAAQPAVLPAELLPALADPAAPPAEYWLPHTGQWITQRTAPAAEAQRWVFWDNVTTRKQAETAQQRSHELLLAVEDVARTGSYEANLATGRFYFSDGMFRLFGEAPQAFVPTLNFIDARSHPDDAAHVRQVLDQAVRTKQPYHYLRRIYWPTGEERTLEAHGNVVCDAAGTPVKLRGLVQDVTERQQAEQQRQQSHALLQATIDSSLDLVQVFEAVRDEQGQVVDFAWVLNNAAAERLYGDVIGQRLCQLNPGVVQEGILDTFKRVLETGVPDQSERHYVHEQFDGWFHQSVVKLGDGVTTTRDITERKQAEQEIRASQHLLQTVFDVSLNPIAYHQALRGAAGNIVDFTFQLENREARKYAATDRTGRRYSEAYPGIRATPVFEMYRDVVETGQPLDAEVLLTLKGAEHWFHLMAAKLDDGLVATAVDITARKQAEQELRETQRLLQTIVDSSPASISAYQPVYQDQELVDFRVVFANAFTQQMTGLNPAGRLLTEVFPTVRQSGVFETVKQALQQQQLQDVELWYEGEGLRHWFRLIAVPMAGQVLVTNEIITERKQAQEEVLRLKDEVAQKATDKYQQIFNSIDEGFCVLEVLYDEEGTATDYRFAEVNPTFERQTGLQHVAGKTFRSLFTTEPQWMATYDRVVKTGESVHFEEYHQGTGRSYQVQAARIGTGPALAVVFQDITERKRREANLAFLASLMSDFAPLSSGQEILEMAAQRLARHLELARCTFVAIAPEAGEFTVLHDHGPAGQPALAGTHSLADFHTDAENQLLASGRPMVVSDVADGIRSAEQVAAFRALEVGALVNTPYLVEGRWVFDLGVTCSTARQWKAQELELLQEVTARVWIRLRRAQAEEALRASEAKYRTLFESIDEGFCIIELVADEQGTALDYRFLEVNPVFERQTGVTGARGRLVSELVPATERHWLDTYAQVVRTGQAVRHENFHASTGRWYDTYAARVDGPGSRQVCIVFNDITARKQAEQRQQFLLKLSDTLRAEPDADAVANRALRLLSKHLQLDRCYVARYRLEDDRADITHQTGNDRVPPMPASIRPSDFPEAFRVVFDRTLVIEDFAQTKGLSNTDRENIGALGLRAMMAATLRNGENQPHLVIVAVSAVPRRWTPGEIALLEEATERAWAAVERARAEEALRISEEKFRAVANLVPDLLWRSTPGSDTTWFNQRWYEYTGQTPDAAGDGWTDAIHPDDRPTSAQRYRAAVADGEPLHQEHRIRSAQGGYRWFQVQARPLRNAHGDITDWFGAATDIHERKLAELRQQFLLQLSDALRPLTAPVEVQSAAARVLGKYLGAGRAAYAEIEADDAHFVVHHDYTDGVPSFAGRYPNDTFGPRLFAELHAGRTAVVTDAAHEARLNETERAAYAAGFVRAAVGVPLVKGGRLVGAFFVHFPVPYEATADEVALVEEVAERTWAAMERARAESALAASEQRLQVLIANLPGAAMFIVDRELRYQLAEGEALRAVGHDPADFRGRLVRELAPPEQWGTYRRHFTQALAGQPFEHEHAQGGRTFLTRGVPLPGPSGAVEAVLAVSYDITARQQAEDALRLSEEKFRTLADTAPALIWFNNERGENQFVNQYFLNYIGHTPESVEGLAWHTLIHPDDAPAYLASYQQAVQQQRRWQNRNRVRRHDGEWHWFENYATPLFDDEGHFLGHVGISADVTAIVRAEEALRASEAKYRTLFETMEQGFGIGQAIPADEATGAPLDWQWLEVNPQFERLTGLSRAAVLSQTTRQLIPGLEEIWYERYAHVGATGETVSFEAYSPVLDSWFDAYVFAVGLPDARRVAVLFTNTTERRRAEAALREAEARHREQLEQQVAERTQELQASRDLLQSVFDTNLIAMSVMEAVRDEAGVIQDFRLVLVSQELERDTGRTDLEGKLYAQEYPGIREVGIFDLAVRTLETGEPQGTEYYYPHEGFSRWYACQFVKLGDGLVATNLDITERKTAEQERLKNLRLLEQAEAVAGLGS
ncbi:PAS domain S-box protein [Hymenobacter sp. CRA2]|uniref:PAS domain S-box protein n=1 Tax=Hymenobacter sp. CRA2 TaxID=1955620 RepID=UPI00098EF9B6|nr:PAS domain S-box protein [Hymenobacter sp. CRA2]OON65276.1 hypothetical protein B0919_24435 [Hymenobacter sp. CRA2]